MSHVTSPSRTSSELQHLLRQQLEELRWVVSATTVDTLSTSAAHSALAPSTEKFRLAHDYHVLVAETPPLEEPSLTSPSLSTLRLSYSPRLSPPFSRSFSSSSSDEHDTTYAHRTTWTPRVSSTYLAPIATPLQTHLSKLKCLLLESDFHLQQQVFIVWKQKCWYVISLRRRLRGAFCRMKAAGNRAASLHTADAYNKYCRQRRLISILKQRVVKSASCEASVARGIRAHLHRIARRAFAQMGRRVSCRRQGDIVVVQQQGRLVQTAFHAWRCLLTCGYHVRRRERRFLTKCLKEWQHVNLIEERCLQALTIKVRAQKAFSALTSEHRRLQNRASSAMHLMTVHRVRASFNHWVHGCHLQRRHRSRIARGETHFRRTQWRRGQAALCAYFWRREEADRSQRRAESFAAKQLSAKTLGTWRTFAQIQATEVEARVQEGATRNLQRRRAWAFRQLRERARCQRQIKALMTVFTIKKGQRRLCYWHAWVQECGARRLRELQHEKDRVSAFLDGYFHRWTAYCRLQMARRRVLLLHTKSQLASVLKILHHTFTIHTLARSIQHGREQELQDRCLQWWRGVAKHSTCLRRLRSARALRRWRLGIARLTLQRSLEKDTGNRAWQRTACQRMFGKWLLWVAARRTFHSQLGLVLVHRRRKSECRCRAMLHDWSTHARTRRHRLCLESEADAGRQRNQKTAFLYALQRNQRRRRKEILSMGRANEIFHRRKRTQGLKGLLWLHRIRVSLPLLRQRAMNAWWLRRAWKVWTRNFLRSIQLRQRQRKNEILSAGQWEVRRLVSSLYRLQCFIKICRSFHTLRQRTASRRLEQACQRWRRNALLVSKLRNFQRRCQERLVERLFSVWRGWSSEQPLKREAVVQCMENTRKTRHFHGWRAVILHRKELTLRAKAVSDVVRLGILRRAWEEGWRKSFNEARLEKCAELFVLRSRGLKPWRRWSQKMQERQEKAKLTEALEEMRLLRYTLRTWQAARRFLLRDHNAVNAMSLWRLNAGWRRWRARAARLKNKTLAENRQMARHIAYWCTFLRRRKRHNAWLAQLQTWSVARPTFIEALVGNFPSGVLHLAWKKWLVWYGLRVQSRNMQGAGDMHVAKGKPLAFMRRLQLRVRKKQHVRDHTQVRNYLVSQFVKVRAFQRLQERIITARKERLAIRRRELGIQLARDRRHCLEQILWRWKAYTDTMRTTREWLHSGKGCDRVIRDSDRGVTEWIKPIKTGQNNALGESCAL